MNKKPNLQHFRRKQAHHTDAPKISVKDIFDEVDCVFKNVFEKLKASFGFFRLNEGFLILRVSLFFAVRTELGQTNSRLTDFTAGLATGNIFILCKGAAHREQANS